MNPSERADVWDEGYEAGLADGYVQQSDETPNPYRAARYRDGEGGGT